MTTLDVCTGVTEAALRSRRGNKWSKYDADVLPAWVADMDFPVAEPIRRTLLEAVENSALGYGRMEAQEELFAACVSWLSRRHGWWPEAAWFISIGDVVQGIHIAITAFTEPGDGVIVQGPIYPPFLTSVEALGRRVVDNRVIDPTGKAAFNLDELRAQAADPHTKMLLLCNPHNPTGRVLTRAELETIAQIALEHDLIVIADEIWMDITYAGHQHIPFQTLGPEVAARTITFTSATKSFNLGGIRTAVGIFGTQALHERFDAAVHPRIRGSVNTLGLRATIAAWTEGEQWFEAAMRQLDENRRWVTRYVAEQMPGVQQRLPEGTFLTWLDFGDLKLDVPAAEFLLDRARVGLNDGAAFGGDAHCARLNFATSPAILAEICERIARAVKAQGARA
jgi:cysteine-S-conjugate beta-lyase